MTFVAWLRQHQHARSAIGDLARDALRDPERLRTLRPKQAWVTVHLKQSDRFWRSQLVAVGMPVTQHPPHRSRRAALPHRAPASGLTCGHPKVPAVRGRARVTGMTRPCVRSLVCAAPFPLASSLPSTSSAGSLGNLCSKASSVLWSCPTPCTRASRSCPMGSPCGPSTHGPGQIQGLPGSVHRVSVHARGLRPRQVRLPLAKTGSTVLPAACSERVGTQE